jgi:hypothetical protein
LTMCMFCFLALLFIPLKDQMALCFRTFCSFVPRTMIFGECVTLNTARSQLFFFFFALKLHWKTKHTKPYAYKLNIQNHMPTQVETILMLLNGYELAPQSAKPKPTNLVTKQKPHNLRFIWEIFASTRFQYNLKGVGVSSS